MFKEIEIKGLVTKRTFVEIDEETVNRVKSVFDNQEDWYETYLALSDLLLSDDREEFIHTTRQGLYVPIEYKVKGARKKTINSKTPVEQVKTIRCL